jgi:hypothetical protein
MITQRLFPIVLAACLSGCVTPGNSKLDYLPPVAATSLSNEVSVAEPFDTVWDRLVGRLATGFFVINNIDKASRLINVSFSSDSPERYVDCGRSTREFAFGAEQKTYAYQVAADSRYKATATWGPYNNLPSVAEISRDTSLDGRLNVYVAPAATGATKVSVNVKYILRITTSGAGTAYNAFGAPAQQFSVPSSSSEIAFTTMESATKDSITCHATGELERTILDMTQ